MNNYDNSYKPLSIKDIDRCDLEYLLTFEGKDILCIKDIQISDPAYNMICKKGEFYHLNNVNISLYDKTLDEIYDEYSAKTYVPIIICNWMSFTYDYFLDHFELTTKVDIRKRKIEQILK